MSDTPGAAPPTAGAGGARSSHATRIVIVDDQEEFLTWARGELDAAAGFRVVGHCVRPDEALATVRASQPDVLLVDFDMPGMNGIEVIRQVRQHAPSVRIVLMSLNDNRVFDVLARTAGAIGFLPKDRFSPDQIRLLLEEDTP